MKDITSIYSDGHNITILDSGGNVIMTPLNLVSCIKDVRYEFGSLVFTYSDGREARVDTDCMVKDYLNLSRINSQSMETSSPGLFSNDSTNSVLARIIANVLGSFLQTPDGIRAIEKELNNYFNGTS